MFRFIGLCFGTLVRLLRARRSLLLENLALRQQLAVLKRRHPRPRLDLADKLFWVAIRRFWSGWQQCLIAVTPETVVRWHKAGFRLYWKLISRVRRPIGRRQTSKEVRELIFRMVVENPTWGAPRIHGELLMLGFDFSERTISRWMKRAPRDPEPASREYRQSEKFSARSDAALAAGTTSSWSKTPDDVGPPPACGRPLASRSQDPSSVSKLAFRRQTSAVGAACRNPACADLCGGRRVSRRLYRDTTTQGHA